jgi:hypothetical protein
MAKYQFIRIQTYALAATKSKRSFQDIMKEVVRENGHCRHVPDPQAPHFIHGDHPADMMKYIKSIPETCKDKLGRKIRKDAQLVISGVASYPYTVDQVRGERKDHYLNWLRLTKQFLESKYGDNLRLIAQHADEAYPHIHFFVTGDIDNGIYTIDNLHAGKKAMNAIPIERGVNGNGAKRQAAYKQAMQDYQDDYYHAVAEPLGFKRDSGALKRKRVTRQQWHEGYHLHLQDKASEKLSDASYRPKPSNTIT